MRAKLRKKLSRISSRLTWFFKGLYARELYPGFRWMQKVAKTTKKCLRREMVRTCVRHKGKNSLCLIKIQACFWLAFRAWSGTSALLWKPLKPPLPQTKARNRDMLKLSAPCVVRIHSGSPPRPPDPLAAGRLFQKTVMSCV